MDKMPIDIEGLSHIEYLIVFNTILFGVVAAEYFTGWGNMLRYRSHVKFNLLHFLWTLFSFLTLIQNWYGIWPRTRFINDNIVYFFYSLVPMFVFHLITVALFPNIKEGKFVDFKDYYEKNARMLFILFGVYFILTITSTYIYVDSGDVLLQNILRGGAALLSFTAAYFNNKKVLQIVFLVLGFVGLAKFVMAIPM